jgi:hypothetical protein
MKNKQFVYCLEAVTDVENSTPSTVLKNLEKLTLDSGITSIYKTCDSIEGLEESLSTLFYDDHHFKDYKVIYMVMHGEKNSICLNEYFYSFEELAELFEGKMKGKILHFANTKIVNLSPEESQYFIDITGAIAISGYGFSSNNHTSLLLDNAFFKLSQQQDDILQVVEELHQKHYELCKLLDFRLYY